MTTNNDLSDKVILLKSLAGDEPIELHGEMVVGRGATADVVIEKDRMSRKHAKLSVGDGALLVEDLGSTNGTFVNDERLSAPTLAHHNDIIRFDTFAYEVYVVGGVDDTEETVTSGEVVEEEVVEAKTEIFSAPKSWALDENPSSEGTQIMSLDMLKQQVASDSVIKEADIETDVPTLVCLGGSMKGKIFRFNTRDKLTKWEIGRDENCDVKIDDGSVSTNHAQLVHEGNRWKLIDLMSANGTYVNDNKGITSYLSSGDKVKFGQVEFLFKLNIVNEITEPKEEKQVSKKMVDTLPVPAWAIGLGSFIIAIIVIYLLLG